MNSLAWGQSRRSNILFFFFLYGGKVHDLARVTKNLHVYFKALISTPWCPSPLRRGRSHVTETDLNSPWEDPRSGFCCTPAFFWHSYMQYINLGSLGHLYMQYTQLGNLPLRDKGIPPGWFWTFCLVWQKSSRPRHKDPSSPRPAEFKCVTRTLWS